MQILITLIPPSALVAGGVSFAVAVLLVLTKRWHGRWSMVGTQGAQDFHTRPTPRVGGIAILAAVLAGSVFAVPDRQSLLWPLLLASTPAFMFGLAEDLTNRVSVRARLLATMACGVLGWLLTGLSIDDTDMLGMDWLLGFTLVSVAFTAFAVGGVANAINIIDGFNGLASGTAIIILTSFGFMATAVGDAHLAYTSLILAGAVLGFGLVNWPWGKLFLGDGGAYFVGFAVE
jgi:UDP-N-acetylmuramyl pentapeptide phosphotransferase/UDP-N-acetylglucosamine-1-phosphate transferase